MKKTVTILSLLMVTSLMAQKFQGKAIYKTSMKMNFKMGGDRANAMSDDQKAKMNANLAKQFQKTFVLTFDKVSSIYKEKKSLNAPVVRPKGGNMTFQVMGGGGGNDVYYKNIKENRFVNKTEIMGKLFLIKDKLTKYDWKLTSETKNIGVHTCYKATYTRQEDRTNMSVENGEVTQKTEKVDVVTTAWYTPSIAVSNGPRGYNGLPGLILELREGNETIICSEIVMNPKDKITIEEPTKGKVVSQEKYRKIMDKKSKDMMEKFKSRRGSKGRNVEIMIGG